MIQYLSGFYIKMGKVYLSLNCVTKEDDFDLINLNKDLELYCFKSLFCNICLVGFSRTSWTTGRPGS